MQNLSIPSAAVVTSLPTPTIALSGAVVTLQSSGLPYWCDGTAWALLGSATAAPAGTTGQLQYNNGGVTGGAANVNVDSGDLLLDVSAAPTAPTADAVKVFAKNLAGRFIPATIDKNSSVALQPAIFRNRISLWQSSGAVLPPSTSVGFILGFPAATVVGTATLRAFASTNLLTRAGRTGYVSVATAGGMASWRMAVASITTGTGGGLGGFFASMRVAITDAAAVTGARAFFGLSSSTAAATNVDPSAMTNCIGLAQLSTDATQLYLVYGGSVAQADIPLGTNFPPMAGAGATNGILYDVILHSPPNQNGVISYRIERVGTAFLAEGTITPTTPGTQTPANTTFLTQQIWRTNNATALAVGIDVSRVYVEVEN